MGVYINFLIKNDFHDSDNYEKRLEYSTKVMNKVFEEWNKLPFSDGYSYVENYGNECEGFSIGDEAPTSFWTYLHDGYWGIETTINDYMFPWKDDDGRFFAKWYCEWLCKVLGVKEAWISNQYKINDLRGSDDPSFSFQDWMSMAEMKGIVELTDELLETLSKLCPNHGWFSYLSDHYGDEFPIFHIQVD